MLSLYEGAGRTALQADKLIEPYKGQWITVRGNLLQVIPDAWGVTAVLKTDPIHVDLVNARFDKKWERELSRINAGDVIEIRGEIGPDQNGQQLYLSNCEYIAP